LSKNIAIIYRNYNKKLKISEINLFKKYCKFNGRKFFIVNDVKLALKLDLDGVYLSSFNRSLKINNYSKKINFLKIGSAHNLKDIRTKENQGVDAIFLASLFKKKKTYLGVEKFKILKNKTKKRIIALGGVNEGNIKMINLLNVYGFAAISYFKAQKKTALKKGPF